MNETRLKAIRQQLAVRGLNALLVTAQENRTYLTGYTGDAGVAVVTETESLLLTDFRYTEQAAAEAPLFTVIETGADELASLAEVLKARKVSRTGFEAGVVTVAAMDEWEAKLGGVTTLVPTQGLVEELRRIKDERELALLRKAAELADAGFEFVTGLTQAGAVERDLALELDFFLRRQGAKGPGFDFIVASGPRGSLPHGAASARVINQGELVTFDFGCFYQGYTSDLTRTVAVGEPPAQLREIYEIVREAQEAGVAAVRPGRPGVEVDQEVRGLIAKAGYGDRFGHGLGHGVGRQIHEAPRLSRTSKDVLAPGMVVTVEPGIYLPGVGGVRIEDMVVVTEHGCERLTKCRRDLVTV